MRKRRWMLISVPVVIPFIAGLLAAANTAPVKQAAAAASPDVVKWGFMAAALVAGLAAVGAAYAVAVVGAAAMGAVAEKPETAGRALIFVGLAEGIAIYGLIIAIMILGRLP
jgi:V/A-type H+-transporting ATPase subunit K